MLSTTLVESVTPHAAPSSMHTEALQIFLVSYGARFFLAFGVRTTWGWVQ